MSTSGLSRIRSAPRDGHQHLALVATTIPLTLEKFHREHVRQLHDGGYDVAVVSSPGASMDSLVADLPFVRAHPIRMTRRIAVVADALALGRWIWLLARLRPSLIYAMTPKASLLAMVAGKLARVPRRIYATGGLRLETERGRRLTVLSLTERITCWASTEVVANSRSLADAYLARRLVAPVKLRCTAPGSSHGVDSNYFRPDAVVPVDLAALGLKSGLPVVGFVGRLTSDKGLPILVAACEQVVAERPLQLLVVGPEDETDSSAMRAVLARSTVPVATTGSVSDVRPYFAAMTVNVLPSLREGFPNVVLEAGAMGVPSVVTDATGCVDSVVEGVTGFVVPVNDVAAMVRALADVVSCDAMRVAMGIAARERVVAAFQPAEVVRSSLLLDQRGRATA